VFGHEDVVAVDVQLGAASTAEATPQGGLVGDEVMMFSPFLATVCAKKRRAEDEKVDFSLVVTFSNFLFLYLEDQRGLLGDEGFG